MDHFAGPKERAENELVSSIVDSIDENTKDSDLAGRWLYFCERKEALKKILPQIREADEILSCLPEAPATPSDAGFPQPTRSTKRL